MTQLEGVLLALSRRWLADDLAREWTRAAAAVGERHRAMLPDLSEEAWPLIGIARVLVEGEGYQPDPEGVEAFITPVLHLDSRLWRSLVWPGVLSPELGRELLAEVEDLVAWHPATPERWALRTGQAACLGEPDGDHEEPLIVHRSPYSWLRSGGSGICLLSIAMFGSVLSGHRGTILVEDREHERQLRAALTREIPRIAVR